MWPLTPPHTYGRATVTSTIVFDTASIRLPDDQDLSLDVLEDAADPALHRLARACKHSEQMTMFREPSHGIVLRSKRTLVAAVLVGPEFDSRCDCMVLLHPEHIYGDLERRLLAYLTQHVQRRRLLATAYVNVRQQHMLLPYLSNDWWLIKSDQPKCVSFQNAAPAQHSDASRLIPLREYRALQSMLQKGWIGHGHIMAGNDPAAWMLKTAA